MMLGNTSENAKNYAARVLLFVAILLLNPSRNTSLLGFQDIGSEIVKKTEQGKFDEAVQIGLEGIRNEPSDEFIYGQIAEVYLVRAVKEPEQKEQWVSKAVAYTEKAISLNSQNRDVAGVHLLHEARSLETAGDLSPEKRCAYYGQATKILRERAPLLKGDQISIDGKTFQLASLRKENDKKLDEIAAKRAKNGCKVM